MCTCHLLLVSGANILLLIVFKMQSMILLVGFHTRRGWLYVEILMPVQGNLQFQMHRVVILCVHHVIL